MDTGKAMALIAIAATVVALFMLWKARSAAATSDADAHKRHAIAAGVVAAIAGFLYYRRRTVIDNIASQYLISPDDF